MSLNPPPPANEPSLTEAEVHGIDGCFQQTLDPIRCYLHDARSTAVNPTTLLQLPFKQDELQEVIDAYAVLYNLLPEELFTLRMDEMLVCRDQLIDLESTATAQADMAPLFTLELELSDRGTPRLAIPQDFVEMLINDAGLSNREIAELLGRYLIAQWL